MKIINDCHLDFEKMQEKHESHMEEICKTIGEDYKTIKQETTMSLNGRDINSNEICDLFFHSTINPQKNQLNHILISIIYNLCAKYSHTQGDDVNAWRLLASACHYGGMTPPMIEFYFAKSKTSSAIRTSKNNSNAAEHKNKEYKNIKGIVINLLESHRPQGGWMNKKQADAKISTILAYMLQERKINPPSRKVPNIYRWLIINTEIRNTYEKNSKLKIIKTSTKP